MTVNQQVLQGGTKKGLHLHVTNFNITQIFQGLEFFGAHRSVSEVDIYGLNNHFKNEFMSGVKRDISSLWP